VARRGEEGTQLVHAERLLLRELDGDLLAIEGLFVAQHFEDQTSGLGGLGLRLGMRPSGENEEVAREIDGKRVAALGAP